MARRCYWDFGDWSDLWRDAKLVPAEVTLEVRVGLMLCCLPEAYHLPCRAHQHLPTRADPLETFQVCQLQQPFQTKPLQSSNPHLANAASVAVSFHTLRNTNQSSPCKPTTPL